MTRFRRWHLLVLPFVTWAVWSCAPSISGSVVRPAHLDLNALRDSILATAPHDSMFSVFEGDEQVVHDPWFGSRVYGIVLPHTASHTTALYHRKFLARLHVDHNYRGLKADTWTYWVVIDISEDASGEFASLWVAPGQPAKLRALSQKTPPHAHPHAKASWLNQSSAVPWATCSPLNCCCEGPHCSDLVVLELL